MPALQSLVDQGIMGNLATLDPPFSPMLWTTIATGVRPDKHGILGFSEPINGTMIFGGVQGQTPVPLNMGALNAATGAIFFNEAIDLD